MAAVPMAAVTMPLEHRASTAWEEHAVCCTALPCSELDTSFFYPCTKEDALSESGAVHQLARLTPSHSIEQNSAPGYMPSFVT